MTGALTAGERLDFQALETVVREGLGTFVEVGEALAELRDRRLYRDTHATFEDYCRESWSLGRSRAYQLIDAAKVAGALSTTVDMPSNEAQARELIPVLRDDEGQAVEIWRELRAEHGDRLTAADVRVAVRTRLQGKQRRELHRLRQPASALAENLPPGRFPVIYADPPWRYDSLGIGSPSRAVENHYPTMSPEDIRAMEIPAADDCVLFLWATSPKLAEAQEVIEAWGFTYRTSLVWVKDRIGMGYWARNRHELVLIAKRGNPPAPPESMRLDSVIEAPRRGHSEKPQVVAERIEAMYPGVPKLELFARAGRPGWTVWGNEV